MKFIDLFSGIGGFRLGLELAGHECVGHCEVDKFADRSYRAMYSCEEEWFINDVRKINPNEMPEFELLCAGFPCQSFSIAGKRRGFEDIRGTEILRQYFINHPQSIDKYTFLQNSAFTHWVKEKCSKMC